MSPAVVSSLFSDVAAPRSSTMTGNAAFLSLALSQRHVSRCGVSEGRQVKIIKTEGGAGGTVSNRVFADAPGKGYVGRRADEEVRNEGVILIGRHRMNSQPSSLVKQTLH
jgi:hypothetical protein